MINAYKTKDVAVMLGCSRQTIWNLRKRGLLRGFFVGRDWRIDERELEQYKTTHAAGRSHNQEAR